MQDGRPRARDREGLLASRTRRDAARRDLRRAERRVHTPLRQPQPCEPQPQHGRQPVRAARARYERQGDEARVRPRLIWLGRRAYADVCG